MSGPGEHYPPDGVSACNFPTIGALRLLDASLGQTLTGCNSPVTKDTHTEVKFAATWPNTGPVLLMQVAIAENAVTYRRSERGCVDGNVAPDRGRMSQPAARRTFCLSSEI